MSNSEHVEAVTNTAKPPGCVFGGFAGVLITLLGVLAFHFVPALSFGPTVYESEARVMVVGKTVCGLYDVGEDPNKAIDDGELARARHDVELIRSDRLIEKAMLLRSLESRTSFHAGPSALLQALTVEQEGDLPVIRISVRSDRADDAQAATDAVLKAYTEFAKQRKADSFDEMKFILAEGVTDLANDLKALEKAYEEVTSQLADLGHNPTRLAELDKEVLALETKSKATATRMDSIKRAMESATSEDEKRFILQRVLEMSEPPAVEVAFKGLRAEADAINAELKTVSEMRDAEATRCRTASKDQIRVTNLGNAIARKREMHRELVDKLKDAALISQYAGYNVTVLSHASNAKKVEAFD